MFFLCPSFGRGWTPPRQPVEGILPARPNFIFASQNQSTYVPDVSPTTTNDHLTSSLLQTTSAYYSTVLYTVQHHIAINERSSMAGGNICRQSQKYEDLVWVLPVKSYRFEETIGSIVITQILLQSIVITQILLQELVLHLKLLHTLRQE
jgi:hypothetical protein